MAVTCPNKNSQEWLDLVKEFGEIKAMYLFTLNNEVIPTINEGNRLLGNNIIKYDKITDYSNIPIIKEDEEYVRKDITWDSLKGKAFYSPSEKLFIDSTNFEYFLRKKETYYDIVTAGGTHYFFEWLSDLNDRGEMFSFGVKFTKDNDSILVQYDPNTNLRAVLSKAKSRPFLSQDKHFSDIYDAIKILYNKVGDIKINIPELKFIGNASNFLGEENVLPDNVIVTPEGSFELNESQVEQYNEMITKYGKARATELLIDFIDVNDLRKYNVDPGSKAYSLVKPNEVDYNFKSVQKILDSKQKVDQWSKQIKDVNKLLDKVQKDLGISKDQIDLIRESEGNTLDEKLTNFIANYSYSVEVNTKEEVEENIPEVYFDDNITFSWRVRGLENTFLTIEEALKYAETISTKDNIKTNYYANLTVPGGTNYTENEISTPLITPRIKGHAQFSTDQGIGWFRSDIKIEGIDTTTSSGRQLPLPEGETWDQYQRTRRILEIQSDLFQKGRDKKDLINDSSLWDLSSEEEFNIAKEKGTLIEYFGEYIYAYKDYVYTREAIPGYIKQKNFLLIDNNKENQFLQLLNKDNNWVTFFIKSIIQDSAKKGYEKVLFPKGETAAKVEGHETIADEIRRIDNEIESTKKTLDKPREKRLVDFSDEQLKDRIAKFEQEKTNLKSQGIEKLKPIEAFYEIKVGNILKKNYTTKEVTDEYGNSWLEISLSEKDLSPIMLNKPRPSDIGKARTELEYKGLSAKDVDSIDQMIELLHKGKITKDTYITMLQYGYGIAPDSSTRMFEKFETLRKFVPFEIEMILDDTLPTFGEYDRENKLIKINPLIASEDTVGHEMGHVLLEVMGGMSNPTIRKIRETLKGSPVETEVFKLYEGYYKSQHMLDLEIVATAIGYDSNKIFADPKLVEQYETLLMRLFRFIKELLGIDKGNVRKLTMMMFQSEKVKNNYDKFYEYNKKYDRYLDNLKPVQRKAKKQERKSLQEEYGQPTEAELDTLESFRARATELMERKIKAYRKTGKIIASKEAIEFLEKIKKAESPEEALYNFLSIAYKSTQEIYVEYLRATREVVDRRVMPTAKDLNRWKNYIDGFGMISDLLATLRPEYKKMRRKDPDKYKEEKDELYNDKTFTLMQEIVDKRNEIIKYYISQGEKILIDFLEPHYNLIEIRRKEELEREYNKLSTEQKVKETAEEYIQRKLVAEKDTIKEWSRRSLKVELLKAGDDISILTRWLDTIVDSRDPIVSAMIKAFTTADFNTHRETLEMRNEIVDIIRELEDFYHTKGMGITDTKKMYDFMLEKNADGKYTGNILRNIRSEYWQERNKKLKELQDKNASKGEINKFKKEWNKLNIRKFDKVNFSIDHFAFLEELHKQKKISRAEIDEIKYNESLKGTPIYFQAVETQTLIVRPDTREEWNEWMSDNVSKYITYIGKWDNPEFAKLEKILQDPNDPRTKFYNFVTKGIHKYGKAIPYSQRLYYRLPAMEKDTAERIQEGSFGTGVKERIKRATTRTTPEEQTVEEQFVAKAELVNEEGDPMLFMPIYYTNPVQDGNGVMLDDKSTDLGMLYFNYFRMAIDYKNKAEILPSMELAKYFVSNRRYLKRDSDGNVIKDALDPERKRDVDTKGINSKLSEQLEDWFEAVFYGLRYKDEGLIKGTNINKAKILDTINKYTAVNMLGLNFVQGIANLALGKATNFIESFGGINYNAKDFAYAEMYYTKNLPLTLGDIGSRKPNSVVNLLNDQFDSLNEYTDGKMKNNTRFKQLFSTDTLFFTSHAGEHMIQSQVLLAMLHNRIAMDSQGNKLGTILDLYKAKDGKLVFDDNKNRVVNWTLKDQKDFMFRMKRVLADLHGDYYHNSIPAFQRLALGRWAGLFRKFIVPGFKRRWSGKHEDALRETTVEGYYLTFGRFAGKLIKDLATLKMDLATEDWNSLTRYEKGNVYRGLGDLAFLAAAVTMGIIFTNMKGDGDDEDEWLISFGAYQSYRFLNEISFFILPNSFLNIMRSPAASMAIVENLFKFLAQLLDVVDGPFERFDRGPWKGHLKLEKHITNFVPGYKQYYRLRDVDSSVSWWKN